MNDKWKLLLLFVIAAIGFAVTFLDLALDFWVQMSLTVITLCSLAFAADLRGMRQRLVRPQSSLIKSIVIGILSAAGLYLFFYFANWAARSIFPFGAREISDVYSLKNNTHPTVIIALITLIIAPGEEIFWRGYLQKHLEQHWQLTGTLLAITGYTAVHLVSGNLMLTAAALTCGIYWCLIYRKYQCLWMVIISHTLWDLAVFVIWPLN